jgi:hypothetical protein
MTNEEQLKRRDMFAAHAMQALLSNPEFKFIFKTSRGQICWNGDTDDKGTHTPHSKLLAKLAYEAADAMMRES